MRTMSCPFLGFTNSIEQKKKPWQKSHDHSISPFQRDPMGCSWPTLAPSPRQWPFTRAFKSEVGLRDCHCLDSGGFFETFSLWFFMCRNRFHRQITRHFGKFHLLPASCNIAHKDLLYIFITISLKCACVICLLGVHSRDFVKTQLQLALPP